MEEVRKWSGKGRILREAFRKNVQGAFSELEQSVRVDTFTAEAMKFIQEGTIQKLKI